MMMQLFQIEQTQTATFGGGEGRAVVSPFRVVSTSRPSMVALGFPFEEDCPDEVVLRYYADCRRCFSPLQDEVAQAAYARLLAGEEIQTMSGKVRILQAA